MSVCGAILCGGQSSRMGAPKHDLRLPDGRSMIQAVAGAVGEVSEKLIVVGPDSVMPGHEHVHDLRAGQGPLAGIEALLASGIADQYLVVPCDVPLMTADLLRRLLIETNAPVTVFRIDGDDRPESLPMRISPGPLDAVRRLLDDGRRAVHGLFGALECEIVPISARDGERLRNINTRDEYEALLASITMGA